DGAGSRGHRAPQLGQAAHQAARRAAAGRHRREGGQPARVERAAALRPLQQAGTDRPPTSRGRTRRAHLQGRRRRDGAGVTRAPRLRERYRSEVAPALMRELGYSNPMAVPRLEKIVLNMGLGEAVQNPKVIDSAVEELTPIAGQKPVVTKAKKAI